VKEPGRQEEKAAVALADGRRRLVRLADGTGRSRVNIGPLERALSITAAVVAGSSALKRRGVGRGVAAGLTAYLLYRGVSGRSRLYRRLGITGSEVGSTVGACSQVTVQRPLHEVYEYLSDPGNLPWFSTWVKHAEPLTNGFWRLLVDAGWEREASFDVRRTVADQDDTLAWCAVEGAALPSAAEVRLNEGPSGTEVHVDLWFVPPAAPLLAPILRGAEGSRPLQRAGLAPSQLLQQELRRLRQLLEAGEIATITGQSSGREHRGPGKEHDGTASRPPGRRGQARPRAGQVS
jgi:uncharacterized membrane protein